MTKPPLPPSRPADAAPHDLVRPATLGDELVEFLQQGVSMLVGTCDASLLPHTLRATGVRVHADRRHVTVYLPEVTSRNTVTDVAANPRVAVLVSQPLDHRSFQLKGRVTQIGPAPLEDQAFVADYLAGFARVLEVVGMPYEVVTNLSHWPSVALELCVEEIFLQTPGPGAGARLSGHSP